MLKLLIKKFYVINSDVLSAWFLNYIFADIKPTHGIFTIKTWCLATTWLPIKRIGFIIFQRFNISVMLEEIIATFLSLFSALTLDAPQISRQLDSSACSSEECNRCTWKDGILHREDVLIDQDRLPLQLEYLPLIDELPAEPTYRQSLLRTLKATVTITLAVLPNSVFILGFKSN